MTIENIKKLVGKQIDALFSVESVASAVDGGVFLKAYEHTCQCLNHFLSKYYTGKINPYNSVMYCIYLYWLSHLLFLDDETDMADKVYYLNKALNGNDIFYAVEMPEHWGCEHPVGSVMGRAVYGDSFYFYQCCTVGGSVSGDAIFYPKIGDNVTMFSGSKILGNARIGNNVVLSANTYVINEYVPDDSIVFGSSPQLVIKHNKKTQSEWIGLELIGRS